MSLKVSRFEVRSKINYPVEGEQNGMMGTEQSFVCVPVYRTLRRGTRLNENRRRWSRHRKVCPRTGK